MKIIQQTDHTLTLRLRPWLIWIFSSVSIGVGLTLMILLAQTATLSCHRTDRHLGQCTLNKTHLWHSTSASFALSDVQGARVQTRQQGDGYTYQMRLLIAGDEMSFTPHYSSGNANKLKNVNQLATFLDAPEIKTLRITEDSRGLAYSLGSLFMVSACSVAGLLGGVVTVTFGRSDCRGDRLVIKRHGLWTKTVTEYALGHIVGVEVEAANSSSNSPYRILLRMQVDGPSDMAGLTVNPIPLSPYFSSGTAEKTEVVNQIHQFLHLSVPAPSETEQRQRAIATLYQIWDSL
jgi:hypothetical protein